MDFKKIFSSKQKKEEEKSQEDKDKTIMDYFSGSNPNRKKVQEIVKKRMAGKKK